jgi:hypothetical protein
MMTEQQIQDLVETKLNEIVRDIQSSLGVETGDEASWYLSGDRWDDMKHLVSGTMKAYQYHEIRIKDK